MNYLRGSREWGRFGSALCLILFATPIWWWASGATSFLVQGTPSICWPAIDFCRQLKFSNVWTVYVLFFLFALLSLITAIGFWRSPDKAWPKIMFAFLLAGKILFSLIDYRFRGNHHQMANLVSILFLCLARPGPTLSLLIPSFYLSAGFLKLNYEWLSGAAIETRLPLNGLLLDFGLYYVVLMEFVLIWWLLERKTSPSRFAFILLSLVAFHLISIPSVGFFYPLTMASLISFFVWTHVSWPSFKEGTAWIISSLFLLMQFYPLVLNSRNDLTMEGRLLAANMIQNRAECRGLMLASHGSDQVEVRMPVMELPIRIWCDPLVFYNFARDMCTARQPDQLNWALLARGSSEAEYLPIIRSIDFCSDHARFPWLLRNKWVVR